MDEYHCSAYPNNSATENSSLCNDDQCFNVEIEYTNMHVLNASRFHTHCDTSHHRFCNISKENLVQETIESWLSPMGVPHDAFRFVVARILECADRMANWTHKNSKVLSMMVDLVVTRASEDESDEEDEEEEDDLDLDDDFEEVEEMGNDNFGLVPASMSSIEKLEVLLKQGNCAICFEDFDDGVRMPCSHMFHANCISSWLKVGNTCPLCRKSIQE